jgi:hypothetical protein
VEEGGGVVAGLTSLLGRVTQEGRVTEYVEAGCGYDKVKLCIAKSTICKNRAGSFLTTIRIQESDEQPTRPEASGSTGLRLS